MALRSRIQGRIRGVQVEAPQAGELHLWNVGLKAPSWDRALHVMQGVSVMRVLWSTQGRDASVSQADTISSLIDKSYGRCLVTSSQALP